MKSGKSIGGSIDEQVEIDDKTEQDLDVSDDDYREILRRVLERDLEEDTK